MDIVLSENQQNVLCYGLAHRAKFLRRKLQEAEEDGREARREQLRAWLSENRAIHELVRAAQGMHLTFREDQDVPPAPDQ